jgi:multiple sugar transport system substrate-binding protein
LNSVLQNKTKGGSGMKRLISIVLVLLLCLSVFIPILSAQEKIPLRVAWWGSQDRHNRTLKAIELFEKKYPNIKVYPEYTAWSDYWTKLNTQAAGKNLPDVIQQDYAYISEWATRGLLLPLDEYVSKGIIDLSNVAENSLSPGKVEGKLYGVNLGTNSLGFVYDPELFKKAGVSLPKAGWTWNDCKEVMSKLKSKVGIYGIESITTADAQVFKVWLLSHGYWLYDNDGKSIGYKDDKLFVDWFNLLLELQDKGIMPSIEVEIARGTLGVEDMFIVTQKSAMGLLWSNQLVAVSKAAKERPLRLALMPRAPIPNARPANYLKASMFFSITSQSKYPKEAAMFIDFFTNSFDANKVLFAERGVPISSKIQKNLLPFLGTSQRETFNYIRLVEKNSVPIPPPDPPGASDIIKNVWNPMVEQIMYGRIAPDKAAIEFRDKVNKILQQK